MTTRIAQLTGVVVLLATAACGQTQSPAASPVGDASSAFSTQVAVILERAERTYGPEAQWEGVEMLSAMSDTDAEAVAFPALQRACLDGRGQDVASLLSVYLDKAGRVGPRAREHAAQRILTQCGVQGWNARSERLGFVETAPAKFSLASERRVIDRLLAETDPAPLDCPSAALIAGR